MSAHVAEADLVDNLPATVEIKLPEITDAGQFFGSNDAVEDMVSRVEQTVRNHVPDLTSRKGRDAIKSLAYNVSRSKTYLDGEGKKLVEGIKAQAAVVDASRKLIRDRLDALRDEARKPLEEWEAAEADRQDRDAAIMRQITDHGLTGQEAPADIVAVAGQIKSIVLPDDFTADRDAAEAARNATMQALRNMFTAAQTREAEAAELAKLREEKAARDAADEAARVEREKAEAERLAADREEQDRKDAEARATKQRRDLADALTRHIRNAGKGTIDGEVYPFPMLIAEVRDRVMRDIEGCGEFGEGVLAVRQEVLAELDAAYQEHKAKAVEDAKAEAARREELAAQRERDRIAAEKRAEEEAQRKREENTRIRNRVRRDIAAALAGLSQPLTPEIVAEALMAGGIPNCTVRF